MATDDRILPVKQNGFAWMVFVSVYSFVYNSVIVYSLRLYGINVINIYDDLCGVRKGLDHNVTAKYPLQMCASRSPRTAKVVH